MKQIARGQRIRMGIGRVPTCGCSWQNPARREGLLASHGQVSGTLSLMVAGRNRQRAPIPTGATTGTTFQWRLTPPRPEAPRLGCGSVRQGEALPQRKGFEDSAHPRFLRGSAHRQLFREPAPTRASNGYFFVSVEAYDAVKAGTRAT